MSSKVVPLPRCAVIRQPRLGAGPRGGDDPVVETDVAVDAGLGRGVLDVLEDGVPVGNRLLAVPGPEGVPEGVHVRVRADAGVAEEVPGAADGVAGLEDGVGGPRALGLEVVGGTDPREPGSDDQDVEVFGQGVERREWWCPLVVGALMARTLRSACRSGTRARRWSRTSRCPPAWWSHLPARLTVSMLEYMRDSLKYSIP